MNVRRQNRMVEDILEEDILEADEEKIGLVGNLICGKSESSRCKVGYGCLCYCYSPNKEKILNNSWNYE